MIPISDAKPLVQRKGYNNQPFFINNNAFLFTADDTTNTTNIFRYNVSSNTKIQITKTAESEYSPTLLSDKNSFSTVRIDKDTLQRLYNFSLAGRLQYTYFDSLINIGYHTWISDTLACLFFVGTPQTLYLKGVSGFSEKIIDNPGRGMQYIKPEKKLYFIQKISDKNELMQYDFATRSVRKICFMPDNSEDLALIHFSKKDVRLITCAQNVIHYYDANRQVFIPMFDTAISEGKITRMAISPNNKYVLVVVNK